jgi:hypothetical protein
MEEQKFRDEIKDFNTKTLYQIINKFERNNYENYESEMKRNIIKEKWNCLDKNVQKLVVTREEIILKLIEKNAFTNKRFQYLLCIIKSDFLLDNSEVCKTLDNIKTIESINLCESLELEYILNFLKNIEKLPDYNVFLELKEGKIIKIPCTCKHAWCQMSHKF